MNIKSHSTRPEDKFAVEIFSKIDLSKDGSIVEFFCVTEDWITHYHYRCEYGDITSRFYCEDRNNPDTCVTSTDVKFNDMIAIPGIYGIKIMEFTESEMESWVETQKPELKAFRIIAEVVE